MDNAVLPVAAGLAVGIAFVVTFAIVVSSMEPMVRISTTADDQERFGNPPVIQIIIEEDDPDGCCDQIDSVTFDHELRVTTEENEQ